MLKTKLLKSLHRLALPSLAALFVALSAPAQANDDLEAYLRGGAGFEQVEVGKDYALGIGRFDLDTHTEIIGWQIADKWYFGRQDGMDSGLTLVWQQSVHQVSLSKDGLRLTKRF